MRKKSDLPEKKLCGLIKKYSHVKYGPLVIKEGNRYRVKDKIGHIVRLNYHPENKSLAWEIMKECWKNGSHVYPTEGDMKELRQQYLISPADRLYEFPPLSKHILQDIDFIISLESRDWAAWSKGIKTEKIKATAPARQEAHKISDRRATPWILVGWPFKKRAQENKISFEKLEKLMFGCIRESFKPRAQNLIKKYYDAFSGAKKIRIMADDGTDLCFSVRGRRFLQDDGILDETDIKNRDVGINIPCGEIFVAPVESSANGTIVFPKAMIPGQGMAEELALKFEKGRAQEVGAKSGSGMLEKFLAQNSKDANVIAEFGIGLNPAAEFTGGEIIIDEKIYGSIHIAVGWNVGFGGKTNASSHLDFIKDLRRGGLVFADSRLLIKNGRLVC